MKSIKTNPNSAKRPDIKKSILTASMPFKPIKKWSNLID
jgi:hypothetical protein